MHCQQNIKKERQVSMFLGRGSKCSIVLHIRRCDDLPATITHVPVAAVLVLNTPDDGRLRPKRLE
jgi:hypothetical protein